MSRLSLTLCLALAAALGPACLVEAPAEPVSFEVADCPSGVGCACVDNADCEGVCGEYGHCTAFCELDEDCELGACVDDWCEIPCSYVSEDCEALGMPGGFCGSHTGADGERTLICHGPV